MRYYNVLKSCLKNGAHPRSIHAKTSGILSRFSSFTFCSCFLLFGLSGGFALNATAFVDEKAKPPFTFDNPQLDSLTRDLVLKTDQAKYTQSLQDIEVWQRWGIAPSWNRLFEAIVWVARYNDLGKKSDLSRAKKLLESLAKEDAFGDSLAKDRFGQALLQIQIGFIEQAQGNSLSGIRHLRAGANQMEDLSFAEASGFYALYAYYLNQATTWIPFVSDESQAYLKTLLHLSQSSPYFKSLFANAAGWMLFDQKKFDEAIALIKPFSEEKSNRVFHQMKADLLRRAGHHEEARKVYEENRARYQKVNAEFCDRDLAAWANLALLKSLEGDRKGALIEIENVRKIITQTTRELPPSLVDELEKEDLWD